MKRPDFLAPSPEIMRNPKAAGRYFWRLREEWHEEAAMTETDEDKRRWHEERLAVASEHLRELG
jgi:uncharacterized protein YciW